MAVQVPTPDQLGMIAEEMGLSLTDAERVLDGRRKG